MVTAELALGGLLLGALVALMCWLLGVVVLQVRCLDATAEIARQAARGDSGAVADARSKLPSGATVELRREGDWVRAQTTLEVAFPLGPDTPLRLTLERATLMEPGVVG